MLDRAMLTLTDQRRARQYERQKGDLVDDLRQPAEPALVQGRVEPGAQFQVDRQSAAAAITLHELIGFAKDDLLDVTAPGKGLRHARRVGVELHLGGTACQYVALDSGGTVEDKGVGAFVH